MPLWPRGTESYMQSKIENKLLTPEERKKVKEDLLFLKSMMGERSATYSSVD